jgi:hypothetical protein
MIQNWSKFMQNNGRRVQILIMEHKLFYEIRPNAQRLDFALKLKTHCKNVKIIKNYKKFKFYQGTNWCPEKLIVHSRLNA